MPHRKRVGPIRSEVRWDDKKRSHRYTHHINTSRLRRRESIILHLLLPEQSSRPHYTLRCSSPKTTSTYRFTLSDPASADSGMLERQVGSVSKTSSREFGNPSLLAPKCPVYMSVPVALLWCNVKRCICNAPPA